MRLTQYINTRKFRAALGKGRGSASIAVRKRGCSDNQAGIQKDMNSEYFRRDSLTV